MAPGRSAGYRAAKAISSIAVQMKSGCPSLASMLSSHPCASMAALHGHNSHQHSSPNSQSHSCNAATHTQHASTAQHTPRTSSTCQRLSPMLPCTTIGMVPSMATLQSHQHLQLRLVSQPQPPVYPMGMRLFQSNSSPMSPHDLKDADGSNSESDDDTTGRIRQRIREEHMQQQAKTAMDDPFSRLMASRGMPLGISVPHPDKTQEDEGQDLNARPRPEPGYQMEALDELLSAALQCHQQAGAASSVQGQHANSACSDESRAQAGAAAPGSADAAAADAAGDSWGTTRESPAEIARRIAESNAGTADAEGTTDDDLHLRLMPGEAKYKTLEAMSKDIKQLDEVFEVLASVPWLDEDDLSQKELKGMAMVGLLGTLEEVGFNIRDHVERIWAGDCDDGMILECNEAKDQAALISILFHTKKLEEEFGTPEPLQPAKPKRDA